MTDEEKLAEEWHFRDSIVRDVIAWCELPKLPKFEE